MTVPHVKHRRMFEDGGVLTWTGAFIMLMFATHWQWTLEFANCGECGRHDPTAVATAVAGGGPNIFVPVGESIDLHVFSLS